MVPCDLQKEESEHSKQLLDRVWQKRKFITWRVLDTFELIFFYIYVLSFVNSF